MFPVTPDSGGVRAHGAPGQGVSTYGIWPGPGSPRGVSSAGETRPGRDERQTMQDAFAIGATFFLQKPVDRQKLSILFRAVRGGMLENQRRSIRVPLQTDVTCEVGSRSVRGVTWNLSQGGIQVEASGLQPGNVVQLSFRLPVSHIDVSAAGTVVWAHDTRQGIRFTKVSEQNQQSIRSFISEVEK